MLLRKLVSDSASLGTSLAIAKTSIGLLLQPFVALVKILFLAVNAAR